MSTAKTIKTPNTPAMQSRIDALTALKLPELWAMFKSLSGEETKVPNKGWLITNIISMQGDEVVIDRTPETPEEAPVARHLSVVKDAEHPGLTLERDAAFLTDADIADAPAPKAKRTPKAAPVAEVLTEREAEIHRLCSVTGDEDEGTPDEQAKRRGAYVGRYIADNLLPLSKGEIKQIALTKRTLHYLQGLYAGVVQRPTDSTDCAYLIWKVRETLKGELPSGKTESTRPAGAKVEHDVWAVRVPSALAAQFDALLDEHEFKSRQRAIMSALATLCTERGAHDLAAQFTELA